jgi:hypothetical protein
MTPAPSFGDLARETAKSLGARLRFFLAHWLVDLAWVAWFFLAKETGAKLCRAARPGGEAVGGIPPTSGRRLRPAPFFMRPRLLGYRHRGDCDAIQIAGGTLVCWGTLIVAIKGQ